MKESTLVKMQYDLRIAQQALVVALERIKKLEEKNIEEKE
jgi:hypothetical protein